MCRGAKALKVVRETRISAPSAAQEEAMNEQRFPPGWDAERVKRVIEHYETASDDELAAEDEAAMQEQSDQVVIAVPRDLLPAIRQLLATHKAS
jgi:hypothetical protein